MHIYNKRASSVSLATPSSTIHSILNSRYTLQSCALHNQFLESTALTSRSRHINTFTLHHPDSPVCVDCSTYTLINYTYKCFGFPIYLSFSLGNASTSMVQHQTLQLVSLRLQRQIDLIKTPHHSLLYNYIQVIRLHQPS